MMSRLEKSSGKRVIDAFYKPFSKEVAKAEEEMEKIQIKDEQLDLTVKCVAVQWSLNLVVLVSSTLVAFPRLPSYPSNRERNRCRVSKLSSGTNH